MGSDMSAVLLWGKEGETPDPASMTKMIREYLSTQRNNIDLFENISYYLFAEKYSMDPLTFAVLNSDDSAYNAWLEDVLEKYRELGEDIVASLDSREVAWLGLPGVRAFMTGGMSSGDHPTTAYGLWLDFFYDEEEGNPLGGLCYTGLGFLGSSAECPSEGEGIVVNFYA